MSNDIDMRLLEQISALARRVGYLEGILAHAAGYAPPEVQDSISHILNNSMYEKAYGRSSDFPRFDQQAEGWQQ